MSNEPRKKDLVIFGSIWSAIFLLIVYLNFPHKEVTAIFIFLAFVTAIITLLSPTKLTYLYNKWVIFGGFIGKINSIIILFLLFALIITPTSFIFKLLRKDLLNKKLDRNSTTYWIDRTLQPGSMVNQF